MNPVRIQRSRQNKQKSPNGLPIVYTGRPGKWGNPFKISNSPQPYSGYEGIPHVFCKTAEQVIENYIWFIHAKINQMDIVAAAKRELRGKNLSCWCKIGQPCHADILLRIANEK